MWFSLSSAEGLHDEDLAIGWNRVGQFLPVLNGGAIHKYRHMRAQRPGILQDVTAQARALQEIGLQHFRHRAPIDRCAFRRDMALQIRSYMDGGHDTALTQGVSRFQPWLLHRSRPRGSFYWRDSLRPVPERVKMGQAGG